MEDELLVVVEPWRQAGRTGDCPSPGDVAFSILPAIALCPVDSFWAYPNVQYRGLARVSIMCMKGIGAVYVFAIQRSQEAKP